MSYLDQITVGSTTYDLQDSAVPSWAKQSTKPSYTASEVGALPSDTAIPSAAVDIGALPSILNSDYYGTTLPSAGTAGRIFFLKVE